ncbi:MAG: hypothetical protein HGN29_02880 [Asgard group archaeon]|nr:hypothetical protein [Asgard group archaeon]
MNVERETEIAEHLLSLMKKKNIWDLDIISSILNINPLELSNFIKTLPMAYGLSILNKKISVTIELVRDVEEEIKSSFINWYQRTVPDAYSRIKLAPTDILSDKQRKQIVTDQQSKSRVSIYGDYFLVEKIINQYIEREGLHPSYKYVGGYEPINFDLKLGNEIISTQFSIIDYKRDILSLAPLLFEDVEGFLFIFDPQDLHQIEKINQMSELLINKRKKDILVSFLAILRSENETNSLNEIADILTRIVECFEDIQVFKVSFAVLFKPEHIERKINDLIQTARLLVKMSS